MNLYDILACPLCKAGVHPTGERLHCIQCGREYPVVNEVPIMLLDPSQLTVQHEADLIVREGYDPWVHRMILQSLTDAQVVVDAGCGNMTLDDPCIIRMDVTLTPYVDVVGDLHALPFKPASIDFLFAMAVVEHLRQPFQSADEIFAALKPGGYVYAECNFIFAYHGYPHHYFNASIHGMKQIFAGFRELRLGVAPYQTPSYALENIVGTYLAYFKPETPSEVRLANTLRHVLQYPLHRYDLHLAPDTLFKLAAGVYFLGIKQPNHDDTLIPQPVMDVYRRTPELQTRFPEPNNLAVPDNLMIWAKTEGRQAFPEIDGYLMGLAPFSKYRDPAHVPDRSAIHGLPVIPHPDYQRIEEPSYQRQEEQAEQDLRKLTDPAANVRVLSLWARAVRIYRRDGLVSLTKATVRYLRRRLDRRGLAEPSQSTSTR